jgi:hypothetical protein
LQRFCGASQNAYGFVDGIHGGDYGRAGLRFELHLGDLAYALTSLRSKRLCQNKFDIYPQEHFHDPQTLRLRGQQLLQQTQNSAA